MKRDYNSILRDIIPDSENYRSFDMKIKYHKYHYIVAFKRFGAPITFVISLDKANNVKKVKLYTDDIKDFDFNNHTVGSILEMC